ncbi:uncharacterized protein LOC114273792 [Camellia sinensis]|uniref:uncharacterized protein LOC114273792 n=1 Tax=Camellia sinensis TaxID=4442 RepID=UPI0010360069|nr:uncharacterized protein LOC114273792 [Camellia sinensis]
MTNIWEQNIREWYDKSGTSRLNYLDLASTEKPSTKELAHNIAVIYDRVCLSSKVNLKEFRSQQIQIQSLEATVLQLGEKIEKLEKGINSLTQVFLESKSWNKEEQQLKSIEGILQQLKRALVE